MNLKNKKLLELIVCVFWGIISFVVIYNQWLYSVDKMVADPLYQSPSPVNKDIKIIAIDEKTIARYGDLKTWKRDIYARLVEYLSMQEEYKPEIIAFDMMFVGEVDKASDEDFVRACEKAGNVITGANLVYKTKVDKKDSHVLVVDKDNIDMVEYPFEMLRQVSDYGAVNTIQDKDGYIRYASLYTQVDNEKIPSFSYAIYSKYIDRINARENETRIKAIIPKTMSKNIFGFNYSGKSGAYEVISLCDVLDGKVDNKAFTNSIVLVGAYAQGMQDAYNVAVQKGEQMYGVEIHANILEALLENKTALPVSILWYSILVVFIIILYYFISSRIKLTVSTTMLLSLIVLNAIIGKLLYGKGIIVPVIDLPIFLVAIYIYQIFHKYLVEIFRRRNILRAFKQYVAPQVVEGISKKEDFELILGGENRHIAVLFVDIRGFTPMSEKLSPNQVVEILNEYLALVTKAIFDNGGTLDKFIGDAAMAVFNAPFDLEDYVYKAVSTAKAIKDESKILEKKLMERFGYVVSFGIGVNCGNAIVGNIGCDFRMDYTAIGDTVNCAARLESNAKPGQILISEAVYEQLKDRIKASAIGDMHLKGKENSVYVYELEDI